MKIALESHRRYRAAERAELYRGKDPAFANWAAGYGAIQHDDLTQVRVYEMADFLVQRGTVQNKGEVSC